MPHVESIFIVILAMNWIMIDYYVEFQKILLTKQKTFVFKPFKIYLLNLEIVIVGQAREIKSLQALESMK